MIFVFFSYGGDETIVVESKEPLNEKFDSWIKSQIGEMPMAPLDVTPDSWRSYSGMRDIWLERFNNLSVQNFLNTIPDHKILEAKRICFKGMKS